MLSPVLEEYFNRFYRVIRVDFPNGERLYSIDFYAELSKPPERCFDALSLGSVKLCYARLRLCEAVVLVFEEKRFEAISLRLKTKAEGDPAEGSLSRARNICLKEAQELLEALRFDFRREG
ncbi:MAG: hypothetical protein QXP76_01250 [Acidilobaceae archaeon]